MTTKGDTNCRWTSNENYRLHFDEIFRQVKVLAPIADCVNCGRGFDLAELVNGTKCPICGRELAWDTVDK